MEHEDAGDRPAWIPVRGPREAEGELAEVYEALGYRTRAARVIAVHALHPRGLEAHVRMYRTLMFGPSPLGRLERESIAVVVSATNDCFY